MKNKDIKLKYFICVTCFLLLTTLINGQNINKNINTDSLMQELVKNLPDTTKYNLIKHYNEGNESEKTFILLILSMPTSSKKELIENYENNKDLIKELQQKYSKLVPDSLIIYIEFKQPNKLLNEDKETIDIKVYKPEKNGSYEFITQEWNLDQDSENFKKILSSIGWDTKAIKTIKQLLKNANCISIENGDITTVGFARSGFGKYSYKIFKNKLMEKEIENYNDQCTYIYYNDNIVLEYGGGAVGSQCFPDEE